MKIHDVSENDIDYFILTELLSIFYFIDGTSQSQTNRKSVCNHINLLNQYSELLDFK